MVELFSFLLLAGLAAVRSAEGGQGGGPAAPPRPLSEEELGSDPSIQQAKEEFEPWAIQQIEEVRRVDPAATSSWKKMTGYLPYLTEVVAMWYMLWDPAVPNSIKLQIGAAILYTISPVDLFPEGAVPLAGYADDALFVAGVLYNAYGYITKEHIRQSRNWLRDHGVEPSPVFALGKQFDPEPAAGSPPPQGQPQLEAREGYGEAVLRANEEASKFSDLGKRAGFAMSGPFPLSEVDYHGDVHLSDSVVVFATGLFPDDLRRLQLEARQGSPADVDIRVSGSPDYRKYAFVFLAKELR